MSAEKDTHYQFTDNRGLPISNGRIAEMLETCGKTEQEIVDFIGVESMDINGRAYYFLTLLSDMTRFYDKREKGSE